MTPWGGSIHYRATTTSTMDDAQALEDEGAPDGSLVWAGEQTAGRGRHPGRTWNAAPGASLLFTVFWRPSRFRVPDFAASLTVGFGVCLWLESLGLGAEHRISLKWPNDVYLGDRKLAGILVRRRLSSGLGSVHAGIGINLLPPVADAYRTTPTSLAEAGRSLAPDEALVGLLPFLAAALDHPEPRSQCAARLWRRGQPLTLSFPDGRSASGIPRDLADDGALIWDTERGREVLSSGE